MSCCRWLRSVIIVPFLFVFASCSTIAPHFSSQAVSSSGVEPSEQVIEVLPDRKNVFQATLTAWERRGKIWRHAFGPWPAVIGRTGFAKPDQKREGDGHTPSGAFALGPVFGRAPGFKTGLVYQQATQDDVWVDDAASAQYNQWVHGKPQASSFEQMLRADHLYDLGAVIRYNTDPVVPGLGSAIFLHIWRDAGRKATAGCVALRRDRVRRLLAWLASGKAPQIIMGGRMGEAP